ncbi:hypothetical protein K2173_007017 [Erythroxylum novogranatense]|uniref:Uncharacterized protein n=1 Tax=Erythroxylum novogranatense TaxID=1862640 RepID=A0AAV8SKB0_9ROSI|nr:hypothetical protein K2173_007017 [Erythroxylum novogranatense]
MAVNRRARIRIFYDGHFTQEGDTIVDMGFDIDVGVDLGCDSADLGGHYNVNVDFGYNNGVRVNLRGHSDVGVNLRGNIDVIVDMGDGDGLGAQNGGDLVGKDGGEMGA